MQFYLSLGVFFCCSLFLKGQDYLDYYEAVNTAQAHIAKERYEEALRIYRSTFEAYEFEFARDCIHACEAALAAQSETELHYFMTVALHRGVPLSYFLEKEAYQQSNSLSQLAIVADSLRIASMNNINHALRQEINLMFQKDQRLRTRYYKWYNLPIRPLIGRKWKQLNRQQVERIIEITQNGGFPGEKRIGIDMATDHSKVDENSLSSAMPIVILLHHYSAPNPSYDSLLIAEIAKGNLNNRHYATICDFEAQYGKGQYANDGAYGIAFEKATASTAAVQIKRTRIQLTSPQLLSRLEKQNLLSKFWRRLY